MVAPRSRRGNSNSGSSHSGNSNNNRRGKRRPDFNLFDENGKEVQPDESVDDGFFSRFRNGYESKNPAVDRQTAESAFDAVDKLFGEMKRSGDMDRQKWLNDIKARAATSGEGGDSSTAVDVDATDTEEDGDAGAQESSFDKLMKFARKGPTSIDKSRRRTPQSKPPRETRVSQLPDIPNLLALTKQVAKNKAVDDDDADDEADYEPVDDEMEKTVVFRASGRSQHRGKGRQKFTAVRRIGTQKRRILQRPNDWEPMLLGEIERYKSDHRSLDHTQRKRKLHGVVDDCGACLGTGVDSCVGCLGAGWIPPLSTVPNDGKRFEMLEDIWNQPNLVVDSEGEAQCICCNGIGKQVCRTCLGSGTTMKKGFSLSDRYDVFDMFPDVRNGPVVEEDGDGLEEEENDDNDEQESFQLYKGSGQPFSFEKQSEESVNKDMKSVGDENSLEEDVDDVLEVDASAELLESLDISELKQNNQSEEQLTQAVRLDDDEEDEEEEEEDDGFVGVTVTIDDDIDDGEVDDDEIDDDDIDEEDDDDDMELFIEDAFGSESEAGEDELEEEVEEDDDLDIDEGELIMDASDDGDREADLFNSEMA